LKPFAAALLFCGLSSSLFALEKGKSSRDFKVSYETKEFISGAQGGANKKIGRFSFENNWKFQLNKKNKTTVKIPYASASLETTLNGVTTKDEVEGEKDISIVHEMTTRKPKIGRTGVKWKFKINLPNGEEQLTASENRVTSAMGETGQGFSNPTYGKGLNLGFDVTLTDKVGKKDSDAYTFGYNLNGSYSSLADTISYKHPGDNLLFNYKRTRQRNKKLSFTWTVGANYTRRTVNLRPGNVESANPSRIEGNASFAFVKQRNKKLKETVSLKLQERGEIEVQESTGQIVRTEQGDRATLSWIFSKKKNKKVTQNYGLNGIFGQANDNLEVVAPTVGNPTAKIGKDNNTKMEEVQFSFGQTYQVNKHRKWFYNIDIGLTDDSRDWVVGAGLSMMF